MAPWALFLYVAGVSAAQLSLEQAVQQVQQQTQGKILAASTVPLGNHKIYRIKVLTPDGRVRVIQVRADTGKAETKEKR